MDKIIKRKVDGAWFENSYPDKYEGRMGTVSLLEDLLKGNQAGFYFRGVKPTKAPWWKFWKRVDYPRTGEIWTPTAEEFDVLDPKTAIKTGEIKL